MTYFDRARHLIFKGIKLGWRVAVVLAVLSATVNAFFEYLSDPAPDRLSFAIFLFFFIIVPILMAFVLSIVFASMVVALFKKGTSLLIISICFLISTVVTLTSIYLMYLWFYPYSNSFIDFVFPIQYFKFPIVLFVNPFLFPSIINIFAVIFAAGKLNNYEAISNKALPIRE